MKKKNFARWTTATSHHTATKRTQILNKRLSLLCALVSIRGIASERKKIYKLVLSLPHVTVPHIHLTSRSNYLKTHCIFAFFVSLLLSIFHFLCAVFITLIQPCFNTETTTIMFNTFTLLRLYLVVLPSMPPCVLYSVGVLRSADVWVFRHLCLFFVVSVWSLTSFMMIVRYYLCVTFCRTTPSTRERL